VVCTQLPRPVFAAAGIYEKINFQGKLVSNTGVNVADGNYSVTFTLYDAASAGNNLWDETQTVAVADGIFRVSLGSVDTTIAAVDFNTDSLFLGIQVEADAEMTPRVRFAAVPYAFMAEKVNGLTVTNTTGTFTLTSGKTLTATNTLTLAGTDGTTMTFPSTSGTVVTLDLAQTLTNKTIGSTGLTFSGATTDITTTSGEALTILPGGVAAFTLGGASTTSLTVTTDGTGDGEVVLPTGSIATGEILDATVTYADLNVSGSLTDEYCLTYEATGTTLEWATCGAGGSQTPWTADIDADGFDLVDLSNILFRETTGAPTGSDVGMYRDNSGDLSLNVLASKTFNVAVNGTDEYTFSSTALNLGTNSLSGTTAAIDFSNFDVDSSGNVTVGGAYTQTYTGSGTGFSLTANSSTGDAFKLSSTGEVEGSQFAHITNTNSTGILGSLIKLSGNLNVGIGQESKILEAVATNKGNANSNSYNGYFSMTNNPTEDNSGSIGLYSAVSDASAYASAIRAVWGNVSTASNTSVGTYTSYGGYFTNAGTTTGTTTAIGIYATASGADNNYAAIFNAGNVGIGTTAPVGALGILKAGNATQSNISTVVANGAINVSNTYTSGNYVPLVNWYTTDNNATLTKASIYAYGEDANGSAVFINTSSGYGSGASRIGAAFCYAGKIGLGTTCDTLSSLSIGVSSQTSGNFITMTPSSTLTGAAAGFGMDLSGSTATGQNLQGYTVSLPAVTNTGTGTRTYQGYQITGGALTHSSGAGNDTFSGLAVTNANLTQTAGTMISNGVLVTTGTNTTGGTQNGLNIAASGIGAGSLNGLNISAITASGGTETGIKVGIGWDVGADISGAITFGAFTTNGGVLYTNASGNLAQTAVGSGGECLKSAGGGSPTWGTCGAGSATAWDDITAPDANKTLAMTTFTTDFNWDTGTSTSDLFSLTTDASSNGTGSLLNVQTGASSTVLPMRVRAGSVEGLTVDADGQVGVGTTAPLYRFHSTTTTANEVSIAGVQLATTGSNYASSFAAVGSGATLNIGGLFQASGATTNYGLLVAAGNVGIGTTTPEVLFEVQGAEGADALIRLDADDGDDDADTWTIESEAADNDLSFVNHTTEVMKLTSSGALTVVGAIAANGGITFDASTDTLGAFTFGGTVDAGSNILTNIGATGTDFTTSGALTIALDAAEAAGALVVDNAAQANPIFVAKDNGSAVLTIADGGDVTWAAATPTITLNSGEVLTIGTSGTDVISFDMTNNYFQVGDASNGLRFDVDTIDSNGNSIFRGTSRPTKTINLSPEYSGAVLTASGSATINGSMTSDASPSAALSNYRTYYEWTSTQTTLQDYTVAVRITLPKDFSAWAASNAIQISYNTELTTNNTSKFDALIYNTDTSLSATDQATPVVYSQANVSASVKTWKTLDIDDSLLDSGATRDLDAAGESAIIYLKMYSKDSNHVQIGDIVLSYLAAF